MRPLLGEDAFADNDTTPLASRSQPPQMSYFIADEKTVESSNSPSPPPMISKHRDAAKNHSSNSTYGVESLETTISSLASASTTSSHESDDQEDEIRFRQARKKWKKNLPSHVSKNSDDDFHFSDSFKSSAEMSRNVSPSHGRRLSQSTLSRPYTPLSLGSPAPPSLLSCPHSPGNSEDGSYMDDLASQAVASSGDEVGSGLMDSGSAPQFVMPSIKMPSRRPFTEKGKLMGKVKILIAGDSGVGKTSLIKAIVQTCEDIVHVDPISSTPISIPESNRKASRTKSKNGATDLQTTSQITEVYASTRPYPSWWSDLEDSKVLKRRKSLGDSILERNLCFVDTPGYSNKTSASAMECIDPVIEYIESHLRKATSLDHMSDNDMISMLGGNGGSQVDLVLYVIKNKVKPVDLEYLRRLSQLTNVAPLIAHADNSGSAGISSLKSQINSSLDEANIRSFQFATSPEELSSRAKAPWAISTTPSEDHENMDASLLMSPDYISPLVESELPDLVSQLFDPSSISWLRHSAAKKFVEWRESTAPRTRPQLLYQPLRLPSTSSSQILTSPVGATTSYALARITDHTQREEKIAQVRLANWAADLQRSIRNERARYDQLARSERAIWLTERLGECVQDGTIIPLSEARKNNDNFSSVLVRSDYSRKEREMGGIDRHDPLGILQLNADVKRKASAAVKLLSGVGVLGGLAFWVVRTFQGTESHAIIQGLGVREWAELSLAHR
ncbi:hypothetical protein HYALB_00010061 [Hymenoscyphus albidus]|uniref:Septin-type G domain-containing protein n=1 Tax=Hymenoscyphus albidus TaxID=595503 RepID=A0A9N9LQ70_9HELO|nr:hypothetical protein HYALB_00010061 [Hymenoscyphus albidus]